MGLVRLLLAMAVVAAHSWSVPPFAMISAQYAVELFFIVSGFYMALVLDTRYGPTPEGRRTFWMSRTVRLLPTYWIVLAVTVVGVLIARAMSCHAPSLDVPWADPNGWHAAGFGGAIALALTNLLLLGQDAVMFLGMNAGSLFWTANFHEAAWPAYTLLVVPPAWSVSIELLFYAIAPFVARWSTGRILALMACSVAVRAAILLQGFYFDPWTYRFFPSELLFFLLGVMAYRWGYKTRRWVLPSGAAWGVFALMVVLVAFPGHLAQAASAGRAGLMSLGLAVVTFVALTAALPSLFHLTRRSRADRFIGDLCYPVYIAHVSVVLGLHAVSEAAGWPALVAAGTPWVLVAAIALAIALTLGVERPVSRMREERFVGKGMNSIAEPVPAAGLATQG